MNGSRIAPIPLAHVQAELAAYPLASESGLTLGLTALRPDLKEETGKLWRDAERALATASPSISLDELVAMRDDLWFRDHDPESELPLGDYLARLADHFLKVQGSVAVPELADKTNRGQSGEWVARTDWRWLSLALPQDLLLAALGNKGSIPTKVETVSPVLQQRWKDAGVAEPHLHLNAGLDFGRIWVNTVRNLADSTTVTGVFKSPGAGLQEGLDLASWLLRAAITRYVLAGFLRASGERDGFLDYLEIVQDRILAEQEVSGAAYLLSTLDDLYRGRNPSGTDFAALRSLYSFLIDLRMGARPQDPDDLWAWDPIHPLLGSRGGVTPEMLFVAEGLRYLKKPPSDRAFAGLFWQVVRVRCLFYRHLVQRPLTPGLQWFVRFFRRMKPTRHRLGQDLVVKSAARLSGSELGLRSLEVRIAPGADYSKLHQEVKKVGLITPSRKMEIGVVIHLTRDRGGEWFEGKPTAHWASSEADPRIWGKPQGKNTTGYRYGRFYAERKKEALAAARLLRDHPKSLRLIRGLDLCTDEAGVPTWVMAPLLRYIRDAGKQASAKLSEVDSGPVPPPLRTTPHAGEDFVHLTSGLRRLDEALDHLGLTEGDRLGHALSLGVEPRTWAQRAGRIPMSEEERLFDLVWEWSWYSHQGQGVPGGRSALIQREIAERSERIFDQALEPWVLYTLVRDLHDERVLRFLGFPDGRPPQGLKEGSSEEIACRYLTSPSLFERGRRIVWVDPALDVEALEHLQAGLRRKVGRMGLTIEVNPSSNLLIGHLGELREHPLWRLAPVSDSDGVPPLSVCIGSDDPLTFATTLPEEYQLLYDAMIQSGCSEAEAQDWLERARKAGMSARFTLPESKMPLHEDDFRSAVSGLPAIDLPP